MVRKLVIAVAAASAVMSSGMVHALGVGDIHLQSSLNQPLEAEIDLLQVRDLSNEEIRTTLASPDDFGRAGIDRNFFLTDLKFQPVVKPDGRSVIRVTSSRPVSEPFLNFLMEVRWPSGKVLREFTVLLDPPLYQPTPVVSSSSVRAPSSSGAMPTPRVAPAQPSAAGRASAAAVSGGTTQTTTAPAPARDGRVTTSRSDTLWELALRNRPQGASVHQTMLAIQDLNPGAFSNGNINQLKAGQNLTLPTAEQAGRRSNSEAVAEVAAQNRAWREGRAPASAEASAPQLDARPRESAGAAPEAVSGEDSLRLVSGADENAAEGGGDSAAGNGAESTQLRDALDRTKEQLDSAEREKAELNDRLSDVQGQVETLQRLLELKDAQLASLQEQVADGGENTELTPEPQADLQDIVESEDAAVEAEPVVADEATDEAGESAESTASTDELAADIEAIDGAPADEAVSEEAAVVEEEPAVASAPADVEAEAAPVSEPVAPAEPAAPAEPVAKDPTSLLQGLMQNQMLLIGGGVVAILLLLLVLMSLSRRNARREAEMADNFIANAADDKSEAAEAESDDFNVALAGGDDSEQDDMSLAADPLVEADALLAYGKPQEARDVLADAIAAEPERDDLRLKLMEVEGLLENAEGYRDQRAVLEAKGNQADRIAELDARFPLMAAAAVGAAAVVLQEDDELDAPAQAVDVAEDDMDFDFSEFDLGDDAADKPADEVPFEDVLAEAPAEPAAAEDDGFDLDFDLDEPVAEQPAEEPLDFAAPVESAPASADAADEFDLSDFELDTDSFELPESATELPAEEPAATLDADFDLSMTEDLEADSLIAEFESMDSPAASGEPAAEESLDLSDASLSDLEAELPPTDALDDLELPAAEEQGDSLDSFELPELDDADLTPIDSATEDTVGDTLDEDDEFDFLSGTDECATKLDLARAYIDMGDQEGARDILNEVVDEGSEQQQQEARSLMERLTD